jgi:hypothetical protein
MGDVDLLRDGLIAFAEDEAPDSNADLDAWVEEAVAAGKEIPEPKTSRAASGPCRLCRERAAVLVCVQCQRDVCREDSWPMMGLCRECAPPEAVEEIRNAAKPRPELGIKWVED